MFVLGVITWVRAVWTVCALVGAVVTLCLLVMAITDRQLLIQRNLNGWRRYVAKTTIIIFLGGFGTQLIYLIAGVASLWSPRPPGNITIPLLIEGVAFIFGAITSIILALVIFYRRNKILWVIERYESKHENTSIN